MKIRYANLRIKTKFLIVTAVVMLAIGISSMLVLQYVFNAYDRELYWHSSQALKVSSAGIENELIHLENLSFRLATDSLIQRFLQNMDEERTHYDQFITASELREQMLAIGASQKYVLSMQILDRSGDEHGTGVRPITTPADKRAIIKETALDGSGAIRWLSPDYEDAALLAVRQIRSYQHLALTHLGDLAVRVDMARMFADYAGSLDREGARLMVRSRDEWVFPYEVDESYAQLADRQPAPEGYEVIELAGKRYFLTRLPSAYMNWDYMILIPYDAIFQTIVTVKRLVAILFVLLFGLAAYLFLRFSKAIIAPIESLNSKMKRVQLGHVEVEEDSSFDDMSFDEAGQMHRNFRVMLQRIRELMDENLHKQRTIHEAEFKALQAQINPHFLYNTLESINWLAKVSGQMQISSMVESLGYLLRRTINNKHPMVTLSEELEIVQHYLTIQGMRFEERLACEIEVPQALYHCQLPKLTLQPLVENAIIHALEQMLAPCLIRIEAQVESGQLIIRVADNGPGISTEMLKQWRTGGSSGKGSGIGLRNIDERIRLIHGDAYGLSVNISASGGTIVTLALPYGWEENRYVQRVAGG